MRSTNSTRYYSVYVLEKKSVQIHITLTVSVLGMHQLNGGNIGFGVVFGPYRCANVVLTSCTTDAIFWILNFIKCFQFLKIVWIGPTSSFHHF